MDKVSCVSTLKLKNCGFPIQAEHYKLIVYYDVGIIKYMCS